MVPVRGTKLVKAEADELNELLLRAARRQDWLRSLVLLPLNDVWLFHLVESRHGGPSSRAPKMRTLAAHQIVERRAQRSSAPTMLVRSWFRRCGASEQPPYTP